MQIGKYQEELKLQVFKLVTISVAIGVATNLHVLHQTAIA